MLDPATLGPGGRTVRCARCKATWFAGGPSEATAGSSRPRFETQADAPRVEIEAPPRIEIKGGPDVTVFVNGVIAETEAEAAGSPQPGQDMPPRAGDDDFGDEGAPPKGEGEAAPASESEQPAEIADAPSLVPPLEHGEMPDATSAPSDMDEVESFAARRQRLQARRKQKRRSSRWTAVLLVLFAFNVAFVGARAEIVRFLPQTASLFAAIGLPVNLRHLNFENVRIMKESTDGSPVLVVQGSIVSTSRQPVEVPRLRLAARNKAGQEIYSWSMNPVRSVLQPGERLDFTSRVAAPPKDAYDVMVRFFTANDAMAGGK